MLALAPMEEQVAFNPRCLCTYRIFELAAAAIRLAPEMKRDTVWIPTWLKETPRTALFGQQNGNERADHEQVQMHECDDDPEGKRS